MNEQQRQNLEKYGTTQPSEPDFVLRAAEVQSEADIVAWVKRELQVGPEGLAEFVSALRNILSKHGEVWIFTEHHQVGPLEYKPDGAMIVTWCKFFIPKPPQGILNSEEQEHRDSTGS